MTGRRCPQFWALALPLMLWSGPLAAQTVVNSGAHEGFSRLVMQFEPPPDWTLGRTETGYALIVPGHDAGFEIGGVFSRIGRERIAGLQQEAPDRLAIALACECHADAFEIRAGRLVIDIKDGAPPAGSGFETALQPVAAEAEAPAGATGLPDVQAAAASSLMPLAVLGQAAGDAALLQGPDLAFGTPLAPRPSPDAPAPPAEAAAMPAAPTDQVQQTPAGIAPEDSATAPEEAAPAEPRAPDTETGTPSALPAGPEMPSREQQSPAPAMPEPRPEPAPTMIAAGTPAGGGQLGLKGSAELFSQSFGRPEGAESAARAAGRAQELQQSILSEFQRAAAQGLITIPRTEIAEVRIAPSGGALHDATGKAAAQEAGTAIAAEPGGAAPAPMLDSDHVQIETAVDRNAAPAGSSPANFDGALCAPDADFAVADWAGTQSGLPGLDGLRAMLVDQLDNPDTGAIRALARRFVALGFGDEAIAILNEFALDSPSDAAIRALAEVIDERPQSRPGFLAAQASCETRGAIWALLSEGPPAHRQAVPRASVLSTFSGLPFHLRQHLGPRLTAAFVAAGDPDSAQLVRDSILRELAAPTEDVTAIEAVIEEGRGLHDERLDSLASLVEQDGSHAPDALASLLEDMAARRLAIDEGLIALAQATAVEHRGTAMGTRLTAAALRAMVADGLLVQTLDELAWALTEGDLDAGTGGAIWSEAHAANLDGAEDAGFLALVYAYPPQQGPDGPLDPALGLGIARRLIDLGFAGRALDLLPLPGTGLDQEQAIQRARAALVLGDPDQARGALSGHRGPEVERLMAEIAAGADDPANAARLFADAGEGASAAAYAWRAGDWGAVARFGSGAQRGVAERLIGQPGAPLPAAAAATPAAVVEAGRKDVEDARALRDNLTALLAPPQPATGEP